MSVLIGLINNSLGPASKINKKQMQLCHNQSINKSIKAESSFANEKL